MKNKLSDLNNHLFEQLERLNDEELTGAELEEEIKRAHAMTMVGSVIVNNAKVVLAAFKRHHPDDNEIPEIFKTKEIAQ